MPELPAEAKARLELAVVAADRAFVEACDAPDRFVAGAGSLAFIYLGSGYE